MRAGPAPFRLLVLAGTQEARQVVAHLAKNPQFAVIASLAGVTSSPLPLAARVHSGGFGGGEGMATFCQAEEIDAIIDVTHPFARQISRNAAQAAQAVNIPCLAYWRPPWQAQVGDNWREFTSWNEMAAAIPSGSRVFLAGGTASIETFVQREDIFLWARALNVDTYQQTDRTCFLNAMPGSDMSAEMALFQRHGIDLLCCKNAGGSASVAKIEAARELGLPIWLLARYEPDNLAGAKNTKNLKNAEFPVPKMAFYDNLDRLLGAIVTLVEND